MSTSPKSNVIDLRARTYARLQAEVQKVMLNPALGIEEYEAAMDRAIAFDRATIKRNIQLGLFGERC